MIDNERTHLGLSNLCVEKKERKNYSVYFARVKETTQGKSMNYHGTKAGHKSLQMKKPPLSYHKCGFVFRPAMNEHGHSQQWNANTSVSGEKEERPSFSG